jgi:predicted DsbA family dithiol-disulfide isomerase
LSKPLRIQFVSDISCSWCAIGLHSLLAALDIVKPGIPVEIEFEPFELNPTMPAGGQNLTEHVSQKYGSTSEQFAQMREIFRQRGAEVGFVFNLDDESRIYNTFDAHRLLHWARLHGRQKELKELLFQSHFADQRDPGDCDLLVQLAVEAELDATEARSVLESDAYAEEVHAREQEWIRRGVRSVPTVVFEGDVTVLGAQSPEAFATLIRQHLDKPSIG